MGGSATAIALWHGIYMPSALLKPMSHAIEAGRAITFKADSFVVSMLPQPKLRLINVNISSAITERPLLQAGLISVEFNYGQWLRGDFFPVALDLKKATFIAEKDEDGDYTLLHAKKLVSDSRRPLQLPQRIGIKDSQLKVSTGPGKYQQLLIDELQLQIDGQVPSLIALRAGEPNANAWNAQFQTTLKLNGERLHLQNMEISARGELLNYPWYATAAIDEINVSSYKAPSWQLQQFRAYLRREDAPEEHQAALSARGVTFEWADGRLNAKQAEWTYTHEQAEAWTFNATLDFALHRLNIRPATIQGSEAVLAQAQQWNLTCENIGSNSTAWFWESGWFDLKRKKDTRNAHALLCH